MYNARSNSLNLLPATSDVEGVQIGCHSADDTANTVTSFLVLTFHNFAGDIYTLELLMLFCSSINVCSLLLYTVDLRCQQRKKVQ